MPADVRDKNIVTASYRTENNGKYFVVLKIEVILIKAFTDLFKRTVSNFYFIIWILRSLNE